MRGLDARAGYQSWIRGLLAGGQRGTNLAPRDSFACFEIRAACLVPCPLSAPFFSSFAKAWPPTSLPPSTCSTRQDIMAPTATAPSSKETRIAIGECGWHAWAHTGSTDPAMLSLIGKVQAKKMPPGMQEELPRCANGWVARCWETCGGHAVVLTINDPMGRPFVHRSHTDVQNCLFVRAALVSR